MNCAVCGNPLLCSRAVFHCSCGVFLHAYCWEKHVLQVHQPNFEVGTVDLDGQFRTSGTEIEQASSEQIASSIEQASSEGTASPAEQTPTGEVTPPQNKSLRRNTNAYL